MNAHWPSTEHCACPLGQGPATAPSPRPIPFKKTSKPSMVYLEKHEMDALLNASNRQCPQGLRDHALLLFLYNSGARASEAAQLTIADLDLGTPPSVTLIGKGGKVRRCPLWPQTASKLAPHITGREPQAPVFLNRRRQPITRLESVLSLNDLLKMRVENCPAYPPNPSALTPSDIRPQYICYVPVLTSTPSALGWDMSVSIPHTSTQRLILK